MSEQKSKQNVSTSSKADITMTTVVSDASYLKHRIIQNFLLIWVDAGIDQSNKDCQNTLAQLRTVVNDVNIFTELDQCIQFLHNINVEKVFVIASGFIGQHLVPDIHGMPQVDAIYIFCGNKSRHEQWTKKWVKIKGVHTEIKSICKSLQSAVKQYNEDSIAVSFVSVDEGGSSQNSNQLEPTFMYTQLFKEILLEMEHNKQSIKDFAVYCRKLYSGNMDQLIIINEFERDYRPQSSIWWYTRECFTYQLLNRALRTLEGDIIINMGFFIHDLHKQIEELHKQQISSYHGEPFTVYRGQGLSTADFEKLRKTKGGLMSFNNFLSTSTKQEVSLGFAQCSLGKSDTVGILFRISVDPAVSSAPFASIQEASFFKTEEEILFSTNTVFRIDEIKQIDKNKPLYQVKLELTADDDQQLRTLTKRMQEEAGGGIGWARLGALSIKTGHFDKAEELYEVLLEQTSDEGEKAIYYNNIGHLKDHQGDYEKAIWYHEQGLEIEENILSRNDPSLATSYNNIGAVYRNMGEQSKALSFYEKALEIYQKTLPSYHPLLASPYNNIGLVYNNMGEYPKALSSHEKALEIREKSLPPNHPDLATSYNNIGLVYNNRADYSKALSLYEKALEILQKTLPPNHPDLASSYNNIGEVYRNMEEYEKALSFYEKSLEIYQKTLPSNHLDFATSYNNIGLAYDNMGEYSKALSSHEKALEIYQKTLPPNHPLLATSYNNIASVYECMKQYSSSLSFYERALNIFQSSLPQNHPNIKIVQGNIEFVKTKL